MAFEAEVEAAAAAAGQVVVVSDCLSSFENEISVFRYGLDKGFRLDEEIPPAPSW